MPSRVGSWAEVAGDVRRVCAATMYGPTPARATRMEGGPVTGRRFDPIIPLGSHDLAAVSG